MLSMNNLALVTLLVLIISGCSAKEFEKGAKDIENDISKIFEVRE